MGWLQDLLQEVPLSSVLRERVALAEERYEKAAKEIDDLKKRVSGLESENAQLRAQISPHEQESPLGEDTVRVLAQLFKVQRIDVGAMATALKMERGVVQYHLDRLLESKMADTAGANYLHGHIYWALTPEGRRYAVEHKLI